MSFAYNPFTDNLDYKASGSSPSSGDVVGPASSTDNDIAIFDGITGKVIKDTGISSIAPTFTGNVTSQTRVIAPFDNKTGLAEGFFFSDGTVAARQVGSALANYFFGNAGNSSMTGIANTGVGQAALASLTSGVQNTAMGNGALGNNTSASANSAFGYLASASLTTGVNSSSFGYGALGNCVTGNSNNAFGFLALQLCNGSSNLAIGNSALQGLTTGSFNLAFGETAGINYTTETGNLVLQNTGVAGDAGVIRIGNNTFTKAFIAGISGVTVPASTAVLIDANGQMGTILSSARYKENIVDMPESLSVLSLRPVSFNYKSDENKDTQYGLIAEEVAKDFPYLAIYKDGQPETVKYHELCVFLLAEIQRLEVKVNKLEPVR